MLFSESSEFGNNNYSGCFLVLIFEKTVKKRQAKPAMNKKVRTAENLRKQGKKRHATEYLVIRESKMRRFCNFWLILFNLQTIRPFSQFIKAEEFKQLKLKITARVNELLKGTEQAQRGKLQRCVSKLSDFSLVNNPRDGSSSPKKGGPKITAKALKEAEKIAIEPETKISQCVIQENQALKSRTAYHFGKSLGQESL